VQEVRLRWVSDEQGDVELAAQAPKNSAKVFAKVATTMVLWRCMEAAAYVPSAVDMAAEVEHHVGGGGQRQERKQEQVADDWCPHGSHGTRRRQSS
jgi:hypothetical protein